MMRPESARRGPEVGLVGGAEDLGGLTLDVRTTEKEPSAPRTILGEEGDDADGDVDTGDSKRGKIPLDTRRRVQDDLPGRLQGHQGCRDKVF